MTRAPRAAAYRTPRTSEVVVVVPASSAITTGRMRAAATPLPPMPLPDRAAMIPATWVPWPSGSTPASRRPGTKERPPATIAAARSGTPASTPVSSTATSGRRPCGGGGVQPIWER